MKELIFTTYIVLIFLMIFYGGINENYKIEYNVSNFKDEIHMNDFTNKIFLKQYILNLKEPVSNITSFITSLGYIQNVIRAFYVKLEPFKHFDTPHDASKLMIVIKKYNYPLEILLHNALNKTYFYKLHNKISITKIYSIYNLDKENDVIVIIIKKPFWIHKL